MTPEDLNVYITTASNAEESSWGTYCPGMDLAPPTEYITCLADLYSVAWREKIDYGWYNWHVLQYKRSEEESETEILKKITETMKHRIHLDSSIDMIGVLLFGPEKGPYILGSMRKPGSAIVDDWNCFKLMVQVFETHCGSLTQYGTKHMRAFANIRNNEVLGAAMEEACMVACGGHNSGEWHRSKRGYSA